MKNDIQKILGEAKVFILDFDGTLVDSNPIKLKAFEKCFGDYPRHRKEILEYCCGNHHTPRHVKFRRVFENILKLPYTTEIEKKMLEAYAAETTEQVIAAKEIPGAVKFLEKFCKTKELALLSSTPHETLLHILEKRNFNKYFEIVQGAPVDKALWIGQFLKERGFQREEVLFVGDSAEDAQASETLRIPFVSVGKTKLAKATHHIVNFEIIALR